MKFKKLALALVASLSLFAAGCGSDSPEDVADAYLEAIIDGDTETALSLSTERTAMVTAILVASAQESDEALCVPSVKEVVEKGDKATVKYETGANIDLVKVNGEWKVDVNKN